MAPAVRRTRGGECSVLVGGDRCAVRVERDGGLPALPVGCGLRYRSAETNGEEKEEAFYASISFRRKSSDDVHRGRARGDIGDT